MYKFEDAAEQAVYDEIISGDYWVETKVTVNGEEYTEADLYSAQTSNEIYGSGSPSVGSCVSGEISATLAEKGQTISRKSEIRPFIRVANSASVSAWMPKGVFYVDDAQDKPLTVGEFTVHGYDAIYWMDDDFDSSWMSAGGETPLTVVNHIAAAEGIEVEADTLTALAASAATLTAPEDDYTNREILGYVAGILLGNFVMSCTGKLRLVPLEIN